MTWEKYIAGLFFAFSVLQAIGQNLSDTIQIHEVSVFAKKPLQKAGLNTTKPDSIALKSAQTIDFSGLVSKYTPIFIKSYGQGATATASFRGTGSSHTQVAWNGLNLNSPMRGAVDLSQLPVFFIDEAVVFHGGSSMVMGSGGLGGSISLQNKPSWDEKFGLETIIEKASFQSNKYFMKIGLGRDKVAASTRVYYENSENNFPFYNHGVLPHRPDTQENTAYWKTGIMQEIYLRPVEQQTLALRFWYHMSNRELPPLMSYEGGEREEYQDDKTLKAQLAWKNYGQKWETEIFSGFNFVKLEYFRNNPRFDFVIDDTKSLENSFMNRVRFMRKYNENISLSTGIDLNYHKVKIVNHTDRTGYEEERMEGRLLFDLHLRTNNNFMAMFLLSPEFYDGNIVFFAPLAGIEWAPLTIPGLIIQANASRNFHKPNLNDLYWLPGGNPGLLPEDGYSGDLSFKYEKQGKYFHAKNQLTLYGSRIENWILWQPASNGAYYWEANNVKDVFSRGLEYQGSLHIKSKKSSIDIHGNYAYTRTSNLNAKNSVDKSRGKQLIYIPKHTANVFLNYQKNNYSIQYSVSYIGKRYTTSSNENNDFEQVLTPYWMNSISASKLLVFNRIRLTVKGKINNLFDIGYQSILWRAMPGRNYSITIGINYKG